MFEGAKNKMAKVLGLFQEDIASIRTSRANPALIENIIVTVYEGASQLKIKELASITSEGPNTLLIQPWDPKVSKDIVRALGVSEIGLSVTVSGEVIRAIMAPLSTQRREEYIRLLKKRLESVRVMIRRIRAEERSEILGQKEAGEISEDEAFRLEEKLQELTDSQIDKIGQLGNRKVTELESL